MGVLQSLLLGLSHVPWQPHSQGPLLRSLSLHRDGYLRGPWEWGWFPERFTSSTPVFQIPVDQEWQAKNGYVIVLLLSHHYIYYWGGCVLPTVFPVTLTKSSYSGVHYWKLPNMLISGRIQNQNVGCFWGSKTLFLNEAKCKHLLLFLFSICKVYNVLSYSTVVDSWKCEIACISNKCPLLET